MLICLICPSDILRNHFFVWCVRAPLLVVFWWLVAVVRALVIVRWVSLFCVLLVLVLDIMVYAVSFVYVSTVCGWTLIRLVCLVDGWRRTWCCPSRLCACSFRLVGYLPPGPLEGLRWTSLVSTPYRGEGAGIARNGGGDVTHKESPSSPWWPYTSLPILGPNYASKRTTASRQVNIATNRCSRFTRSTTSRACI